MPVSVAVTRSIVIRLEREVVSRDWSWNELNLTACQCATWNGNIEHWSTASQFQVIGCDQFKGQIYMSVSRD